MTEVPHVLFVCTHNAGRSQMAAALLDPAGLGLPAVRPIRDDIRHRIRQLLTELTWGGPVASPSRSQVAVRTASAATVRGQRSWSLDGSRGGLILPRQVKVTSQHQLGWAAAAVSLVLNVRCLPEGAWHG